MIIKLCIATLAVISFSTNTYANDKELFSEQFHDCMSKSTGSSYSLSECIAAEHEIQDKYLNDSYKTLMNQISAEWKGKLLAAQRLWMQFRDANCELYQIGFEMGNIAPVMSADCELRMTVARAAEINNFANKNRATAENNADTNSSEPSNKDTHEYLASLLSEEDIYETVRSVYHTAMNFGIDGMFNLEKSCWNSANSGNEHSIAICAVQAFTGGMIDATFARTQMRGAMPDYEPQTIRRRVINKSVERGLTNERASDLIAVSVGSNIDLMLSGLMKAGMR